MSAVIQTTLWVVLKDKLESENNHKALADIETACNDAEDILSKIPDTFPTYTLHDATHCMNVCALMAELIGEENFSELTSLEIAFLLLSAFYHDIGMVYTPEEKTYFLESQDFVNFLKQHRYANDKIKANNREVPDGIAEWFFRSIHPQRMGQVPELVIGRIPIRRELVALCKSHGNNATKIIVDKDLTDFNQRSADLVFCAVILRLADILDFDQSRSPEVLYEYLKLKDANTSKLEDSKKEFLKHKEALGFVFPKERESGYKLPFNARCVNIEIEHDIRSFLNVINTELKICIELLSKYKTRWDKLVLPSSIDIKDSYGVNYQYGQYLFTIEKDKTLELFTGKRLYSDNKLFVRELLQNAIDTILHRQLYEKYHQESHYQPDINITTWTDDDNYQWIRIDDNGMGMDERKIREYFLKVAKSYYASTEFEDEINLYEEKRIGSFTPISRFGIGVLSCFLAGDIVEISTRTHNSKSIRLSMREVNKYFTMQFEEKGHRVEPMPSHPNEKQKHLGYRNKPGTSVAVRIAPYQHFEELNFDWIIKEHLYFPPVSVSYNGKKLISEDELCSDVNKVNTLKFPIPEEIIKKIEQECHVTIHENPFIKIDFYGIADFITEPNKGLMNGALFLMDACVFYTDDFYEKNNIVFTDEFYEKNSWYSKGVHSSRLTFYVRLRFDEIEMQVSEDYHLLRNISEFFDLPKDEADWLENHLKHNSTTFSHYFSYWISADLKSFGWFNKYLKEHPKTMTRKWTGLPFADDLLRSQVFAHNGIVFFDGGRFKDSNMALFELLQFECVPIVLFRDSFRPELTISRETIQSLPLEMLSELNLAFRKAFIRFRPHWEIDKDKEAFHNHGNANAPTLYQDLFSDETFRNILHDYRERRPIHTITASEIFKLNNFDTNGGWSEYFDDRFPNVKNTDYHNKFLSLKAFTDVIYAAWIQKNKKLKLIKQQDKDYVIVVESTTVEYSSVIYDYYPPLFFLPVDNETSLFIRYNGRGYINLNHPDSKKIISITETLHNKYPALFRAFKDNVYAGYNPISQQNEVFGKIKTLSLWNNS